MTGHHRKHAIRLLRSGSVNQAPASRPGRRVYDAAVREIASRLVFGIPSQTPAVSISGTYA
ncbi:hypothetical protein [Methylobacterium sp. 092160098-2]|uniref:hypothetical protein n=1 Tax=Methylobacterium sp. 092160098-2 TaxID=3025129 RepID=UPI00406CA75B